MDGLSYPPPSFVSYIFLIGDKKIKYHFHISLSTNRVGILIFFDLSFKATFSMIPEIRIQSSTIPLWWHWPRILLSKTILSHKDLKRYVRSIHLQIHKYNYSSIAFFFEVPVLLHFCCKGGRSAPAGRGSCCSLMSCGSYISCGSTYPQWKAKWQAEIC